MSLHHFLLILAWLSSTASPGTPAPIPPPDLTKCQLIHIGGKPHNCCMPVGTGPIKDFTPPPHRPNIRVRPAAHLVNSSYIAKYAKAVQMMRNLPTDHPWHHMQQANIHCAYCEGAYNVTGTPFKLQIHSSWLFFPFHRIYLYFYERILAKLIGDDETFAVPFWNWDAPDGMTIPPFYADNTSSLYDNLRDKNHQITTIVDLNFDDGDYHPSSMNTTDTNLRTMYRQMITNAGTPPQFLGQKYSKGSPPLPGGGQFEMTPHNTMHSWTGDGNEEFRENMGVFYSAARDPIFYAHHANIDRLWEEWKTIMAGKKRKNYYEDDADWLDTAFLFWDENMDLVRVRVRDCLDMKRLGYIYQEAKLPWKDFKPVPSIRAIKSKPKLKANRKVIFPLKLNSGVSLEVERKRVSRSRDEKEKEEEILVIDEIEVEMAAAAKFDVYVNAEADDESITPGTTQFVGSFVNVPMTATSESETMKTRILLGLTEVLNEIGADGDSSIIVSLVPRTGGVKVAVGGVWIQFGDQDDQLIENSGEMISGLSSIS